MLGMLSVTGKYQTKTGNEDEYNRNLYMPL